jgi:hypothetical protein
MDEYTLMIIIRYDRADGSCITSQLKSFPSREMANRIHDMVLKAAEKPYTNQYTSIIKLYE